MLFDWFLKWEIVPEVKYIPQRVPTSHKLSEVALK